MEKLEVSAYLMLAEDCNLKCSYCYEGNNKKKGRMSNEIIDKSLEYIYKYYKPRRIILFGGEPTLNEKGLIKALKEIDKDLDVSMVTNGVFVSEDILNAIAERENFHIQISLDGNYSSMQQRVGKNYEMFEKIVANTKRYGKVAKYPDGVSKMTFHITVTRDNINSLYENVLFLLNLDLALNINTTPDFNEEWDDADSFMYANQLSMIKDLMIKRYGFSKYPSIKPINTQTNSQIPDRPCSIGFANFIINSEGNVYPCSRMYTSFGDRFKMGNVYDDKPADNSLFKKLDLSKTKCGSCKLNDCVRCAVANLEKMGSLEECSPAYCKMAKESDRINKIYKEENMRGK